MKEPSKKRIGLALLCMLAVWGGMPISLYAVDTDGDGIDDAIELTNGYNPNLTTRIIYVDATRSDDSGTGLSPATAKRSIKAGVNAAKVSNVENVVLVSAGTYAGSDNRNISFEGYNIKLRATQGASATIVDLQNQGRFLQLQNGEDKTDSWLEGFTIKNGRSEYYGGALSVTGTAGLTVKNCVFRDNTTAGLGGAVYCENANVDINNSKFINNRYKSIDEYGMGQNYGGAAYFGSGNYTILKCEFLCNYSLYGGALSISEGTLNISASVFSQNSAYSGGAIYSDESATLTITNSLALGNNADYCGLMNVGYEASVSVINSTFINSFTKNGSDIVIGAGTFNLHNSILIGTYSGTPNSVQYSRTTQDSSGLGPGNITSDPQVTSLGYLKSSSPCIDAAGASFAPSTDKDGQARPVGNAPDMGCYEFLDTDNDGIPDNVEISSGLNSNNASDANGDADNDGITNINEFLNGTNPGMADTDQDGIPDNVEVAQGFNPLRYTNCLYVNPAQADNSGDGLTQNTAKKTIKAAMENIDSRALENVIILLPGTYSGVDNRDLTFDAIDIKIKSLHGPQSTVVDLGGASRFIHLTNTYQQSVIEGISIKNGFADNGSAIRVDSSNVILRNCIFTDNRSSQRGCVYSNASSIYFYNCVFENNHADCGGAILLAGSGQKNIENLIFRGNSASYGGAVYLDNVSSVSVNSTRFFQNYSGNEGGAVFMSGNGTINVTNALFNNNRAKYQFSDFSGDNSNQSYLIRNSTFNLEGTLPITALAKNYLESRF